MAKTSGPLASFDASGKFADTIVYSKWRGVRYARLLVTPSNPQTLTQMAARAFLAAVGKITKKSDKTGDEVTFIKGLTPGGQSWNSYFGKEILGTGNANIEAAKTAYNNVANATVKGYFDDAAAQAGIEAVDLDGTSNTQVAPGLSLWAAYAASYRLGSPDATTIVTSVNEAGVFAYTEALTGVLPT